MQFQWVGAFRCAAFAVMLLAGCANPPSAPPDSNVVVIATAGPMTGRYAQFGKQLRQGSDLAVRDLNASGGVLGKQIRLEVGDDDCDRYKAASVARRFVRDGVVFVAGHFCSGSSIPAGQIYTANNVLQISPASTNPALTDLGGDNVFRVCGRDDRQGSIVGEYLANNYRLGNVAILHDGSGYGRTLADAALAALRQAGVEPAHYQFFGAESRNISGLVANLTDKAVDAVFIGGYHELAGRIARQMQEAELDAQIIGTDALVTTDFWAIAGEAGEGTLFTFGPDPRDFPSAEEVVGRSRAEGYEPQGYALYAYAAVQVWAQAAEAAGSFDTDSLIAVMRSNQFESVIGDLRFDANGDVDLPGWVFYRWSRGDYAQMSMR